MKSLNPIPVIGVPASPYTRKMVALLRYRRIPYTVEWGNARELIEKRNLEVPKPVLLPVMIFEVDGAHKAITDSTPIIHHLENEFPDRGVIPHDPKLAFLNYVLEDFGDACLTFAVMISWPITERFREMHQNVSPSSICSIKAY